MLLKDFSFLEGTIDHQNPLSSLYHRTKGSLKPISRRLRRQEKEAQERALQASITAQANREASRRVAGGEGRDYGHTQTRSSSGWRSSPFYQGGLATMFERRR